ncbi:MAG: hypothetical protein ACOYVF_14540 [Candidatus Zixiibacteriota bacterium]
MKKISILLMVFLLLSLSVVNAQEEEVKDDLEVIVFGGLGLPVGGVTDWHDSLGAGLGWNTGLEVGYFVTPNLVLGLNFTYYELSIDVPSDPTITGSNGIPGVSFVTLGTSPEGLSHRYYNPSLYLKYYFFGESQLVPYVKGHIGIDNAKFTTLIDQEGSVTRYRALSYDPNLAFGFGGGIFYYTSDFSGLFLECNMHYSAGKDAEKEFYNNTYIFDENAMIFDIHAGVSVYFGAE